MMNRRFLFAALMTAVAAENTSTGSTPAPDEKAKEPKHNISSVARAAILAGKSNADALAEVQAAFPEASTSVASIAWYRNDLRKKGHDVKSPARPKAEKPAKTEKPETAADAKTEATAKPTKANGAKAKAAQATGGFE